MLLVLAQNPSAAVIMTESIITDKSVYDKLSRETDQASTSELSEKQSGIEKEKSKVSRSRSR